MGGRRPLARVSVAREAGTPVLDPPGPAATAPAVGVVPPVEAAPRVRQAEAPAPPPPPPRAPASPQVTTPGLGGEARGPRGATGGGEGRHESLERRNAWVERGVRGGKGWKGRAGGGVVGKDREGERVEG